MQVGEYLAGTAVFTRSSLTQLMRFRAVCRHLRLLIDRYAWPRDWLLSDSSFPKQLGLAKLVAPFDQLHSPASRTAKRRPPVATAFVPSLDRLSWTSGLLTRLRLQQIVSTWRWFRSCVISAASLTSLESLELRCDGQFKPNDLRTAAGQVRTASNIAPANASR